MDGRTDKPKAMCPFTFPKAGSVKMVMFWARKKELSTVMGLLEIKKPEIIVLFLTRNEIIV